MIDDTAQENNVSKKAQDYDVFKSASPEMQEFIKEIDDMIDEIEYSSMDSWTKLQLVTKLLEAVENEKQKRGL